MTEEEILALSKRFRVAFAKADKDMFAEILTSDFEWHQHYGDKNDAPTGRVLQGIDALMEELHWRRQNWSDVKFENMEERAAGDMILQTFVISGTDPDGPFHAKAVDIYPIVDGRIARKDTYWKRFN